MNFFSLALTVDALQQKRVKTHCLLEGVGQFEPRFQGKGVVTGEYFFGFYKTRYILLSDSANCTEIRTVVLTQYRRVTDGQTDGIAVASTALAMRCAVKTVRTKAGSFDDTIDPSSH